MEQKDGSILQNVQLQSENRPCVNLPTNLAFTLRA